MLCHDRHDARMPHQNFDCLMECTATVLAQLAWDAVIEQPVYRFLILVILVLSISSMSFLVALPCCCYGCAHDQFSAVAVSGHACTTSLH